MKHLIFLLITIIFMKESKTSTTYETTFTKQKSLCANPCYVCQNSIYILKLLSKIDCFSTECPELCSGLRNDFFSQESNHISLFRNNELTVCETCFRLSMCHMNDCIQETSIIKNAISNSLQNNKIFHKIVEDKPSLDQINKLPSDFSLNFHLIFNNGKRLMEDVKNYLNLFYYSDALKKIYINFYEKITHDNFLVDSNITATTNWQVFEEFLRKNQNLEALFQNYLMRMNSLINLYQMQLTLLKTNFNHEILFNSLALSEESKALAKFLEFNNQMKIFIDEIFNFTELMNFGIQNNLLIIRYVKQAFFKKNFRNNISSNHEEPAIVIENNIDGKNIKLKNNLQNPKENPTYDLFKSTLNIIEGNNIKQNNTISISNKKEKIKEKLDLLETRLEKLDISFLNLTKEIGSPDSEDEIDKISDKRRNLSRRIMDRNAIDDLNSNREKFMNKKTIKRIVDDELEKDKKRDDKEKEKKYKKLLKKTYHMLANFNKNYPFNTLTNSNKTDKIPPLSEIDLPKQAQINTNVTIGKIDTSVIIKSSNLTSIKGDEDILIDKMDFNKLEKILNSNSTVNQTSSINDAGSDKGSESVFKNLFLEKSIKKLDKDFNYLRRNFDPDLSG